MSESQRETDNAPHEIKGSNSHVVLYGVSELRNLPSTGFVFKNHTIDRIAS